MERVPYYTEKDLTDIASAKSYTDMFIVAERVLNSMPKPRAQVCGPISTGGAGSVQENLKRFDIAILELADRGVRVFNQMPFEEPMQRLKKERNIDGYDMDLLNHFYLPIFEGRYVQQMCFLPDWMTSFGARWEHEQAQKFNIDIKYL